MTRKKKLGTSGNPTYFKAIVKSLVSDSEKVLGEIELLSNGKELVEKIDLLSQYLSYIKRLCDRNNVTPKLIKFPLKKILK